MGSNNANANSNGLGLPSVLQGRDMANFSDLGGLPDWMGQKFIQTRLGGQLPDAPMTPAADANAAAQPMQGAPPVPPGLGLAGGPGDQGDQNNGGNGGGWQARMAGFPSSTWTPGAGMPPWAQGGPLSPSTLSQFGRPQQSTPMGGWNSGPWPGILNMLRMRFGVPQQVPPPTPMAAPGGSDGTGGVVGP